MTFLTCFCTSSCIDVSRMNKKAVTETVEDTSIKISQEDISLDLNGTFLLNVVDAEEINYYWTSGNTNVICVLGAGKSCNVMGVGAGESYVKVRDDIGNEGYCNVTVSDYSEIEIVSSSSSDINNYVEDVSEINLSLERITLEPGGQGEVSVSVAPGTAIKTNPIYYVSTDSTIAEVYEGGVILARNVGYATIQVICGNKSKSFDVEVIDNTKAEVSSIECAANDFRFTGKGKQSFEYSIMPANLSYLPVTLTVGDSQIANVSILPMLNKVVVSSKYPGSTYFTLTCGGKEKKFFVEVRELPPTSMTINIQSQRGYFRKIAGLGDKNCYCIEFSFTVSVFPSASNAVSLCLLSCWDQFRCIVSWPDGSLWGAIGEDGRTGVCNVGGMINDSSGQGRPTFYVESKGDIKKDKDFIIDIPFRGAPEYVMYFNDRTGNERGRYYFEDAEGRARLYDVISFTHAKE